jgi:hypothetical protein
MGGGSISYFIKYFITYTHTHKKTDRPTKKKSKHIYGGGKQTRLRKQEFRSVSHSINRGDVHIDRVGTSSLYPSRFGVS